MEKGRLAKVLKLARFVVLVGLASWFVLQCVVSVRKLLAGKIGTSEWTRHVQSVQYPSLTMCFFKREQVSMADIAANARTREEDLLLLYQGSFDDGSNVTFDASSEDSTLAFKAYEKSGTFSVTVVAYRGFLARCLTYNPPRRSAFGVSGSVIFVTLNATSVDHLVTLVHDRGMAKPPYTKSYGSVPTLLASESEIKENDFIEKSYEVTRTEWKLASSPNMPCADDGAQDDDLLDCIHSKLESEVGCVLPWRGTDVETQCNTNEEVEKLADKLNEISDAGEQEIARRYGCLASCHRFSWSLREMEARKERDHPQSAEANGTKVANKIMTILDPSYTVKEQYLVYDRNSLIADVGGYLGLLLGQSILTSFDLLIKFFLIKMK